MTADKSVSVIIYRFLHKYLAVVDQKSTDTVGKNIIVCFEKYICHFSYLSEHI